VPCICTAAAEPVQQWNDQRQWQLATARAVLHCLPCFWRHPASCSHPPFCAVAALLPLCAVVKDVEQQFKYTQPVICPNPTCGNKCVGRGQGPSGGRQLWRQRLECQRQQRLAVAQQAQSLLHSRWRWQARAACAEAIIGTDGWLEPLPGLISHSPFPALRTHWSLVMDQSYFVDWQKAKVQENPDEVRTGLPYLRLMY